MLDIKKIRENPELIDQTLEKRNHPAVSKDLLSADEKNRNLISELQKIQEERNSTSGKNIGTKIIKISVHSRGQPSTKIIICVSTKNCQGCKSIDLKKCSNTS